MKRSLHSQQNLQPAHVQLHVPSRSCATFCKCEPTFNFTAVDSVSASPRVATFRVPDSPVNCHAPTTPLLVSRRGMPNARAHVRSDAYRDVTRVSSRLRCILCILHCRLPKERHRMETASQSAQSASQIAMRYRLFRTLAYGWST